VTIAHKFIGTEQVNVTITFMKWEYYRFERLERGTTDELNELGLDGWELVSVISDGGSTRGTSLTYFLKRLFPD
jgi:hypothetical protein